MTCGRHGDPNICLGIGVGLCSPGNGTVGGHPTKGRACVCSQGAGVMVGEDKPSPMEGASCRDSARAQGKCWGQVGCEGPCFAQRGDAEPSAGGGNAIKRWRSSEGTSGQEAACAVFAGLNVLFLPYSKSPSCCLCCTRVSSSPKQTTGETSTRPRMAAGKVCSHLPAGPPPQEMFLCSHLHTNGLRSLLGMLFVSSLGYLLQLLLYSPQFPLAMNCLPLLRKHQCDGKVSREGPSSGGSSTQMEG